MTPEAIKKFADGLIASADRIKAIAAELENHGVKSLNVTMMGTLDKAVTKT
jgi:hypothetical protein